MNHPTTIIGLGVMGQRMLGSMHRYAGFDAVVAWDPNPDACAATATQYPAIRIASSAADAIDTGDSSVVYIACPPVFHETHARAAFDHGKAVWCEKPLGVDIATSEALVERAGESGLVNIVNFSLASAVAAGEVERMLAAGQLGEIIGIDIRVHFSQWPREWQMAASGWLSFREEGGYTREVVSHWIYLTERLSGPAVLQNASVHYPDARRAETHLTALLSAGHVPITVAGSAGGIGPDLVEYTIWGERSSCRIVDWNRLYSSDGGEWKAERTDVADPREAGYERQLENAAKAVAGDAHTMPNFANALSVQRLIEAML